MTTLLNGRNAVSRASDRLWRAFAEFVEAIDEADVMLQSSTLEGEVVDVRVERAATYHDSLDTVLQLQRGCEGVAQACTRAGVAVAKVQRLALSPANVVGKCPDFVTIEVDHVATTVSSLELSHRWFSSGVPEVVFVPDKPTRHVGYSPDLMFVDAESGDIVPALDIADSGSTVSSKCSGGVQVPDRKVCSNLKFGDWDGDSECESVIADAVGVRVDTGGTGDKVVVVKFWRDVVRSPNVKRLATELCGLLGVDKLPGKAWLDLALSTYTGGTVPVSFKNGRVQLKALSLVGDAALTEWLAIEAFRSGGSASSTQEIRSRCLGTQAQCLMLNELGWLRFVAVPTGVSPLQSKVGADVFEAFAGVISLHFGREGVAKFCQFVRLRAG